MNIPRTWKWILALASAIVLIASAKKSVQEIVMWDFWKNLNAWRFFSALAAATLIALGISWFMNRLNFRFKSVAKAFDDLRKELRDGHTELDKRIAALEKARPGKE